MAASQSLRTLAVVLLCMLAMAFHARAVFNCRFGDTYTDGDTYDMNLRAVTAELRQGYVTGQRINPTVYGMNVCREEQSKCIACAKRLLAIMKRRCGNSRGAQLSDGVCSVRYEPYEF